jgi:hypothetical protein
MFGSYLQSCKIIADLAAYMMERQKFAANKVESKRYDAALSALRTAHELLDIEEKKCRIKYLEMMNGGPEDFDAIPYDPRSIIER